MDYATEGAVYDQWLAIEDTLCDRSRLDEITTRLVHLLSKPDRSCGSKSADEAVCSIYLTLQMVVAT